MNAAVIVLYYPDMDVLTKNVKAIVNQVDKVVFCDNGHHEESDEQLNRLIDEYKVEYINLGGNMGIAYALNRGVEYCRRNSIKWLLTLDQDSVCPADIIKKYEQYTADDIGILTCSINYNDKELEAGEGEELTELDECITSASYTNVDICAELGGFDEQMFIDRVDFEYCYRLKKAGYRVVRVNSVVLNHQLGDLELKSVGKKTVHVGGHGAVRKYYIAQNFVYCTRKHPDIAPKSFCVKKLLSLLYKTIVYEDKKIEKTKSIFKGIRSGKKMTIKKDEYIN